MKCTGFLKENHLDCPQQRQNKLIKLGQCNSASKLLGENIRNQLTHKMRLVPGNWSEMKIEKLIVMVILQPMKSISGSIMPLAMFLFVCKMDFPRGFFNNAPLQQQIKCLPSIGILNWWNGMTVRIQFNMFNFLFHRGAPQWKHDLLRHIYDFSPSTLGWWGNMSNTHWDPYRAISLSWHNRQRNFTSVWWLPGIIENHHALIHNETGKAEGCHTGPTAQKKANLKKNHLCVTTFILPCDDLFHNFSTKSLWLASPDKIGEFIERQISVAIVRLLHQLLPCFRLLFLINLSKLKIDLSRNLKHLRPWGRRFLPETGLKVWAPDQVNQIIAVYYSSKDTCYYCSDTCLKDSTRVQPDISRDHNDCWDQINQPVWQCTQF